MRFDVYSFDHDYNDFLFAFLCFCDGVICPTGEAGRKSDHHIACVCYVLVAHERG